MSLYHAVAFVDHQSAEILQFGSEQVVDHPSENQRVALARQHFVKYDQIVGIRVPT